jgi:hypothetical protein
MERDIKASARRFGLAKDTRNPGKQSMVRENAMAWEIYNHKATLD